MRFVRLRWFIKMAWMVFLQFEDPSIMLFQSLNILILLISDLLGNTQCHIFRLSLAIVRNKYIIGKHLGETVKINPLLLHPPLCGRKEFSWCLSSIESMDPYIDVPHIFSHTIGQSCSKCGSMLSTEEWSSNGVRRPGSPQESIAK